MRRLFSVLLAGLPFWSGLALPSVALTMGVSGGWSPTDLARPTQMDQLQSLSGFRIRWDLPWMFTEMGLALNNRAQALSSGRNYVFDTAGLALEGGLKLGWLRVGSGFEATWLRQILPDSAAPGTLRFHNGAGFIVEPYAGLLLPFLQTSRQTVELSVHYPLPQWKVDPAIGPRLLFTLWFSGPATAKPGAPEMRPVPRVPGEGEPADKPSQSIDSLSKDAE
ncbi:MAG: hypothetical protein VKN33_06305 [Candidatus Sericytochromatia bacterium]|nr:hypothetical protein [Candidatus Sericytochromatia bacterium]